MYNFLLIIIIFDPILCLIEYPNFSLSFHPVNLKCHLHFFQFSKKNGNFFSKLNLNKSSKRNKNENFFAIPINQFSCNIRVVSHPIQYNQTKTNHKIIFTFLRIYNELFWIFFIVCWAGWGYLSRKQNNKNSEQKINIIYIILILQ